MTTDLLSHDLIGQVAVILLAGARHGIDADHLAAIDGLTRFNATRRPRLARRVGALFSLGHGAIVIAVALGVTLLAQAWAVPAWMASFGAWTSIVFLLWLGLLNLRGVWAAAPAHRHAPPTGVCASAFGALSSRGGLLWPVLLGALFALSFDTLSLAALFGAGANAHGGWPVALLWGVLFTAGMLLTDGINGVWVARVLRRTEQSASIAPRLTGLAVAGVSLLTAGLAIVRQLAPQATAWAEGRELLLGGAVIAVVLASSIVGIAWGRRARPERYEHKSTLVRIQADASGVER